MSTENRVCFVIGPIDKPGSDIRKRAEQIFTHIIEPVASTCGYSPVIRADKISEPGLITAQIVEHILNDAMVVADLTGPNANVFYELALRHALRKPVVQMIEDGQQLPFDVSTVRTIKLNYRDLDSAAAAKADLQRQMEAVATDPTLVDNPISSAIDVSVLNRGNSVDKVLAQLVEQVGSLNAVVGALNQRIGTLEYRGADVRLLPGATELYGGGARYQFVPMGSPATLSGPIGPDVSTKSESL